MHKYIRDQSARAPSVAGADTIPNLRAMVSRQFLPLSLAVLLVYLLWDKAATLDFAGIWVGTSNVALHEWLLAAGLSVASLWAVGRYDAVVHRLIKTDIHPKDATRAGITAIVISQSVGFGVVSGALVRWRMLPGLTLLQSFRVSITVALSFLAGWAVITAGFVTGFVTLDPGLPPFSNMYGMALSGLALAILAIAAAFMLLSVVRPGPIRRLNLPSLRAMGLILALVLVDTVCAAGALYAVLPASVSIGLLAFIVAFLIALGAGLILGTPGGVGPFEVTLLALLPHAGAEDLLAGILAFRIVYYAVPALIGAALVIRGPRGPALSDSGPTPNKTTLLNAKSDLHPKALNRLILNAPDSETALLRHGRLAVLNTPDGAAMVGESAQSLILLRDVFGAKNKAGLLKNLHKTARAELLNPCLYKAPPRLALAARQAGWCVLPVAKEAVIKTANYSPQGRAYRQLRRKIRKAEQAGITITCGPGAAFGGCSDAHSDTHSAAPSGAHPDQFPAAPLPLADMARIAKAWAAQRGGERGFSMGVFDAAIIHHSQVFLAWQGTRLVGFLTLHASPHDQVLDLMRYGPDAPEGGMHLLLDHALRTARDAGVARVSLAAVPIGTLPHENPLFRLLRHHIDRISGADGLRQFKACFAPYWQVTYMAAPSRLALVLAAVDIGQEIARGESPAPRRNGGNAGTQGNVR